MYCPYTNVELASDAMNSEHIVPLSLGGANQFVIAVDAKFNSRAGSKIDGDLANDILVLPRRIKYDARGHSKKAPVARSKQSTMGEAERPVQIELFSRNGLKVYDPIERRELKHHEFSGTKLTSSFRISRHSRILFAAKVALAGGYFVFGEWFRENVAHHELRALMNFSSESKPDDFKSFGTRAYDEFSTISTADREQQDLDSFICSTVHGSCVYFVPGPSNLGVVVGVLGQYVASLNIPANTDDFPFTDENDLGHAVILENSSMTRMSYRELIYRVSQMLPRPGLEEV